MRQMNMSTICSLCSQGLSFCEEMVKLKAGLKNIQFQSYSHKGVVNPLNRSFFKSIFSFTVLLFSYQNY